MKKINIEGIEKDVQQDVILETLTQGYQTPERPTIVAALVDNKLAELVEPLGDGEKLEWVDLSDTDGMRIYQRSLLFIFVRAVKELFADTNVIVKHSLSKGLFCEFEGEHELSSKDLPAIRERMEQIIQANEKFVGQSMSLDEAREEFARYKMQSKIDLLRYREKDYVKMYALGWLKDYFYGYMVPSTGYIKEFELVFYKPGIIIRHPVEWHPMSVPPFNEQKKLYEIHDEAETWGDILDVSYVANLNDKIEEGMAREFIMIAEALHEKKVAQIADRITEEERRVVLIAGPSSSGKTTFANRLKIQLRVNGLRPVTLSTDDYFVNREDTPVDKNGEYDFDSIEALDVELFNHDLNLLLEGETIDIPKFDFQTGLREYVGKKMKIEENQLIIIEGIHGLNEQLTWNVHQKDKFKIYISALTQLNIDSHNRIPTTDTRIIRRIVRDNNFRGHDALRTFQLWKSVRNGEEKNIFPYQEDADVMFNSALVYELAILKKHAMPLLEAITQDKPEYSQARRLMLLLSYFSSIEDDDCVPKTSILKEFIGGSNFEV
jgi:uridine kinase